MQQQPGLKRSLSLTLLVLYGLGTTIGAGIYVLIGKVAGEAGILSPLSFLLAAAVAAPTALSFGELAARFPRSAGEAVYVEEGFGHPALSTAVGLAVVFVGLVSCAAIVSGAVGYLQNIVAIPFWTGLLLIVAALGLLATWGIAESVAAAAVATLLEIGGLLVIVWFGREAFEPARIAAALTLVPPLSIAGAAGVLSGSVLAFYAFIGFEDMVNVSEEVQDTTRNMPRAITITLVVTAVLYVLVSWVSVAAVPVDALAASTAPMSDLFERLTGSAAYGFDMLVVVAVTNGALIQIIMAARVLYGLAQQGWIPGVFGKVAARTRTPALATAAASGTVFVLAVTFPLEGLARTTAFTTLLIFALVNVSLLRVRRRQGGAEGRDAVIRLPLAVPVLGLLFSAALAGVQAAERLGAIASP
jgi:basic amino acid/polyamine antiporter, APA family